MAHQTDARVEEYISQFPSATQERLKILRKIIYRTFPIAIEDISYKMPAYRLIENKMPVVFFSAYEKHIALYAVLIPNESLLYKKIQPNVTGKGTLRFDNDKPFPVLLIEEVPAHHFSELVK